MDLTWIEVGKARMMRVDQGGHFTFIMRSKQSTRFSEGMCLLVLLCGTAEYGIRTESGRFAKESASGKTNPQGITMK